MYTFLLYATNNSWKLFKRTFHYLSNSNLLLKLGVHIHSKPDLRRNEKHDKMTRCSRYVTWILCSCPSFVKSFAKNSNVTELRILNDIYMCKKIRNLFYNDKDTSVCYEYACIFMQISHHEYKTTNGYRPYFVLINCMGYRFQSYREYF